MIDLMIISFQLVITPATRLSERSLRTAITLLRPLSNELNTPLHHPQHQLINTYVSASVNIRPGNKKSP